jgi:hypothetical protein
VALISLRGANPISIKPPKLPKIHKLSIARVKNGLLVTHHFNGAKPQQFSFQNPAKMLTHLRRTLGTQWLHPNVDKEATRIDSELNI